MSDYLAINNARPNARLPRLLFRQLSKKSFRTYMLAKLEANRVGATAILYRLVDAPRRAPPARCSAGDSWRVRRLGW